MGWQYKSWKRSDHNFACFSLAQCREGGQSTNTQQAPDTEVSLQKEEFPWNRDRNIQGPVFLCQVLAQPNNAVFFSVSAERSRFILLLMAVSWYEPKDDLKPRIYYNIKGGHQEQTDQHNHSCCSSACSVLGPPVPMNYVYQPEL